MAAVPGKNDVGFAAWPFARIYERRSHSDKLARIEKVFDETARIIST